MHVLTLNKVRSPHLLETKGRYDLLLNGNKVSTVYYNMRGYLIDNGIPLPGGGKFQLPECSLTTIKREIAAINREARA